MEIEVENKQKQKVRRAADVFRACPRCESPNLFKFEDEVSCNYCGWDSIELRAAAMFRMRKRPEAKTIESISESEERASAEARTIIFGSPFHIFDSVTA